MAAGWAGLLLLARPLAAGSVELNASAGQGTGGGGAVLTLDLGSQQRWSLSANYGYTKVTQTSLPSETHEAGLALGYGDGGAWTGRLAADYSDDPVNSILYAGPALGVGYTAYTGQPTAAVEAPQDGDDQADEGEDDDGRQEAWGLNFDATVHGYDVSLGNLSRTALTKGGAPYTLVNLDQALTLTQFAPSVSADLPLGPVTLSASYSHDFYDKDPVLAASIINSRLKGAGVSRVSSLSQGLYYDTWNASVAVSLPWGLSATGSYGRALLISPAEWSQTLAAELGARLGDSWSVTVGGTDTVEAGEASTGATAAVTEEF